MKNFIQLLIVVLFISSCNSKKENYRDPIAVINSQIKEYINQNANDPKSYEPIATVAFDTLYYKNEWIKKIEDNKSKVKEYSNGTYKDKIFDDERNTAKIDLRFYEYKYDSLVKSNNPNSIAVIEFVHDCRLKNSFGALIKQRFLIYADSALSVYYITDYSNTNSWLYDPIKEDKGH